MCLELVRRLVDDIEVMPWEAFLDELWLGRLGRLDSN